MRARMKLAFILSWFAWALGAVAAAGLPYGRLDWMEFASVYYPPRPEPPAVVFLARPIRGASGFVLGVQPRVVVTGAGGSPRDDDSSTVLTLSIKPGTGQTGATLVCDQTRDGVTSMTVDRGLATFSGCRIDLHGIDYILVAMIPGAPGAESRPFNITLAGDFNGDGRVSVIDYSGVVTHFGKRRTGRPDWTDPTTRAWRADLDGDERVGVTDYSILVTRFATRTDRPVPPTDSEP